MKLICTLLLLLGFTYIRTSAQDISTATPMAPGHYIVVAAFFEKQADFADRYAGQINKNGLHAKSGFDQTRKLNYVYLDYYADFNTSIQEMLKVRKAGGFTDAWVRVMKGNIVIENKVTEPVTKSEPVKVAPKPAAETPVANTEPVKTSAVKQPTETRPNFVEQQPIEDTVKAVPFVPTITDVIDNPQPDPVYRPQILKNTPVFLSMFNPANNDVVQGEIEVIDTERSKLLTKVKGNDYLKLPDPKSKSGQLTLISTAFGYRKVQHEINYSSTESDTLQPYVALVGNYYMVSFDMVRLHRGDIATLYNVYFYNDAAIMQPESKYELNALLKMMKENMAYRVTLHGHTNGRSAGKLITRGPSNDFFQVTSDVKRSVGTAKDLSRERAEIIKDWLVANGVTADRVDIKAWGGSRMIHDKNGVHARKNVRVEVEVNQD